MILIYTEDVWHLYTPKAIWTFTIKWFDCKAEIILPERFSSGYSSLNWTRVFFFLNVLLSTTLKRVGSASLAADAVVQAHSHSHKSLDKHKHRNFNDCNSLNCCSLIRLTVKMKDNKLQLQHQPHLSTRMLLLCLWTLLSTSVFLKLRSDTKLIQDFLLVNI